MDLLSNVNVHEYIDRIPEIVLLIRLENNKIIGAYSSIPYDPVNEPENYAEGYIFSISN
jgi:hypothetical protein